MGDASTANSRFVEIRKDLGMTLREISKELGVVNSLYHHWETGQALPRKPNALAIQALYGYRWEWVMTGQGPKWTEAPKSDRDPAALSAALQGLAEALASAENCLAVALQELGGRK